MFRKLILLSLSIFYITFSFAQLSKVSGTIKDTVANIAVKNAVVALVSPKDSILKEFTRTKDDGSFSFSEVLPGDYILMVMHPLFGDYVDNVSVKNREEVFSSIPVTSKSKLLAAIILKSGSPIKIKGDTTIYTADSFNVSANANVEELLKKLPGIQVDKNGEIKAMGEKVEKVLVDGEEFFGDDPGMAVKNLRADAVKEVQVFDKKSEQAEFTGIDDGKTQKTINLKLKEDKKTGYFGKVDVSGGLQKNIDDRYNNNLLFSTFKGKRKLSAFLLNGNTGQDGLNWQDMQKYGGDNDNFSMNVDDDGGMFMWTGGNNPDEEPQINTDDGYIRNINAGAQYSNKWNDKQTFNFSPKFNSQIYENTKQVFTQTQLDDSVTLNENSNDVLNVNRHNIKLKGVYDIKIDTSNSLKITANANFYHTESEELRDAVTKGQDSLLKNTSHRSTQYNNDKYALTGNALFKHKFKKTRRTISLTADWTSIHTDGINFLNSLNETYIDGNLFNTEDLNQKRDYDKSSGKLTSKLTYTEPLNKSFSLEIGHEFSYTSGSNDQVTYSYTPGSGKYDAMVDSLTNDFDQSITIQKPSVKISYAHKKLKYNLGSGFGFTHFDLKDNTYQKDYLRNFTNFFPTAGLTYNYKSNYSLKFTYSGYTTQPTINQLQPLRNNDDYFNQYIGNPNLKPSFTNSFNITHNGYNFIKERWTYKSVQISQTSNSITNNRIINPDSAKTTTQPINTNGNISGFLWAGVGFKIKKINTRFQVGPQANYSRFADVINNQKSFSRNLNGSLYFNAQKSKDKKYDFSLNENFSYNTNSTSQSATKIHYYSNDLSFEATVYYKKTWSLNSNLQYTLRQKTEQFRNDLHNELWNAKLQKTFKKNEFSVYVFVRDILNQNRGIQRSFYSNTLTEERNERLKRYFLVGFAWDFKNKASTSKK